jgi:hypothetical protein
MVRKAQSPSMLGYLLVALAGLLAGIALGALGGPSPAPRP